MPDNRGNLRGTVLSEDPRTERFVRELLTLLGFQRLKFYFKTAPSGEGDAGAWVRAQYPSEVNLLRRKRHQRLALIAVRDGDNRGYLSRKSDLDVALNEVGFNHRAPRERIVNLVPTWSIETWLLALLGVDPIDETATRKVEFERSYRGKRESEALRDAADAWHRRANQVPNVPSLADSKTEMRRIDVP
jgi:hypothetical protein